MESQFYQLCKERDYCGMIEVNIPLMSRREMGARFTLRQGNTYAMMEVTDSEIAHTGNDSEVYCRIFNELQYRLQEELKRAPREKTLCSTCIKRDVDCSCDCAREYRKRDDYGEAVN